MANSSGGLWGGRFSSPPSPELTRLSKSTHFDWVLARYDLLGSAVHARALARAGYLETVELEELLRGLKKLDGEVLAGRLLPAEEDEDVHSVLERALVELVGSRLGGKLRAGRSRNDQIATLIRLYLLDHVCKISGHITEFIRVLVNRAREHRLDPLPGRTHLQHAQPVLLSHHLLAHAWPLVRDLERLDQWSARARACPYGAGALAGSTLGLDVGLTAKELGLNLICPNSIDATASRDVVAEFAFIAAMVGVNLSRFSEEIILWNTREFDYVVLDDAWATGSSIMPQKKNPDIAELARGKSGRLIGNLCGLLSTLKAMPLAYNRDLQEDKEPIFDSVNTLELVLPAFTGMVRTLRFNVERMAKLAPEGFALATDAAEWLVKQKVSFRQAHEIVGRMVARAEELGVELVELSDQELGRISPYLDVRIRQVLSVEGALFGRDGLGGTAPVRVDEQLLALEEFLESRS